MEDDAVLLMQCANEVAHVRSEHALHRTLLRRHHMDLDIMRAQRRRDLEPDKTGTDYDYAARAVEGANDRPAIRQRA